MSPASLHKQPGDELLEIIFDHVRQGDEEPVRIYLEAGYPPNTVNERGNSLLMAAACNGRENVVKLLLGQPGIEVDFQNPLGFTALAAAGLKGHIGIMTLLIAAGANVDQGNCAGQKALMLAALNGCLRSCR